MKTSAVFRTVATCDTSSRATDKPRAPDCMDFVAHPYDTESGHPGGMAHRRSPLCKFGAKSSDVLHDGPLVESSNAQLLKYLGNDKD